MSAAAATFDAAVSAHRDGDLPRAERLYREVIAIGGAHASSAHNNLGLTLAARGRIDEAASCFRRALEIDRESSDAACNLAQALLHGGAALEAGRALADFASRPGIDAGARRRVLERLEALALHEVEAGALERGWALARSLASADADSGLALRLLARCLRGVRPAHESPELRADLLRCLASERLDHRELAAACARLLRVEQPALFSAAAGDCAPEAALSALERAGGHRDPLLLGLLERSLNVDPVLELALTRLRGALLARDARAGDPGEDLEPLLRALALQAFTNEHVFSEAAVETDQVAALDASLTRGLAANAPIDERAARRFCLLAAYRPLHRRADATSLAERLREHGGPDPLVRRALDEPLSDAASAASLARATITDPVSSAVREQYEASPYPRWLTLEEEPADSVAGWLRHWLPGFEPPDALSGDVRVLIAGCGTGEHALRVARRHPSSQVLAIDLSAASLAYAKRKSEELGIGNVRFRHQDLLTLTAGLGAAGMRFHLIESVGVLHHLAEPARGLAVLAALLAPDGVIKIGLYSRAARADVTRARARIAELGLPPCPGGIRALRARVLAGAEPSLRPLTRSPDFYSLSGCRDLLFHVQEHQFDLPAVARLLAEAGLRPLGFALDAATRARYRARFPEDPSQRRLDLWARFESEHPETFAGMYQLWCAPAPPPR